LNEALRWQQVELSTLRKLMQNAPADAINLSLGELKYPFPQELKDHVCQLMPDAAPGYTPNAGLPELRELVAVKYEVSPQQVCITNGAQEALFLSLFSLLNPGDTIAIPDPDFPAYASIAHILDAEIIRLPYAKDLKSIPWDLWQQRLSSGVNALVLSSPNNPCGYFLKEADAIQLGDICNSLGITVVVDEIYKDLVFAGTPASLMDKVERLFVVSGLSKSHLMTGWRLGWTVVPPSMTATITKAKQYLSTCSTWLSQKLAVHALGSAGSKVANDVFIRLLASRGAVLSYLNTHFLMKDILVPDATPYLLIRCPEDDFAFATELAGRGVLVAPGSAFGAATLGMIRINYGMEDQSLISGLKVIHEALYPY